jgi:acyl-CoA thioester hydrolase
MIHQVRVIFGDTDQTGAVYYANYLRWFESARAALCRERGISGRQLTELGVMFPVAEVWCKYRRPTFYEDLLDVEIQVTQLGLARIRFGYHIRRDGELIVEGHTLHACVDVQGKPVRIPEPLRAAFASG